MRFVGFACIRDFMRLLEDKKGYLKGVQENEK